MQGLNTGSFFNKHQSVMGGTKQSLGLMRPDTTTEQKMNDPGKTAGGALAAGMGGATGGALVGSAAGGAAGGAAAGGVGTAVAGGAAAGSAGLWWGAAIGGAIGFASYLMS